MAHSKITKKEKDILHAKNAVAMSVSHAKAQALLTEFCIKVANTGVQVILESHSEHVLNGLRIAAKQGKIPAENILC